MAQNPVLSHQLLIMLRQPSVSRFSRMPRGGFPMPAMSAAFVLPLILLIFLVSFSFLALPLAPTLKVTFKITSQIYPPAVQVTEAIYNKVSLFATTSTTKGNIILSYLGVTTGSYSLFIAVSYGATTLSTDTFSPLGDGLYQLSVTYLPRWGEQSSTPYIVAFTLFLSNGQPVANLQITVYPT